MVDIEENAFQIARYLIENNTSGIFHWSDVRKALNLSPDDFQKAYKFLKSHGCCHAGGQLNDAAIIIVDDGIYPYINQAKRERINLSRDAEQLLKYLAGSQQPDLPFSDNEEVMSSLQWDKERYMDACQILSDEGFLKGQYVEANPFWTISLLPDGRKIVRMNFRLVSQPSIVYTGDITTNVEGNNNMVNIGSILTSVSQYVAGNLSLSDLAKEELDALLKELNSNITKLSNNDEAEVIAELARNLVENATKAKPNKMLVEISAENLKKAAKNLASVAPEVLTISLAIIKFIQQL